MKQIHATTTYTPVKNQKKLQEKGENPYAPRKGDTAAVVQWRQRMGTPEAQEIYKQRCSSAEWVNAGCRNRGWYRVLVRGRGEGEVLCPVAGTLLCECFLGLLELLGDRLGWSGLRGRTWREQGQDAEQGSRGHRRSPIWGEVRLGREPRSVNRRVEG